MRNSITTIIFFALIVLLVIAIAWGFKIGNLKISSVSQILATNQELEKDLNRASTLTATEYPSTIKALEETYQQTIIEKEKYEELAGTSEKGINILESKQYDIAYIWKIIGRYATSRNLKIGMNIQNTGNGNLYNLSFEISGQYTNISQLIIDLENNSDLNFRIYNFKMTGSGEKVTATFVVKDVNINPNTITKTTATNLNNMPNSNEQSSNSIQSLDKQNSNSTSNTNK